MPQVVTNFEKRGRDGGDYNRPRNAPRAISDLVRVAKCRTGVEQASNSANFVKYSLMLPGATRIGSQKVAASLNVERLRTGDLAVGVGGDLVDPRFRLPQQFLAAPLQGLAPLVDGDGFLQRHLAAFEPRHDGFKLLHRAFEAQLPDVHLGIFSHIAFPGCAASPARIHRQFYKAIVAGFIRPSMPRHVPRPTP